MLRAAALFALLLATPALAQEAPSSPGDFLGRVVNAIAPRAPDKPTADFVVQSRRNDLDYRPFDPTPARGDPRKRAEELARTTSRLEAAAAENSRKAARVRIPN